MHDNMSRDAGYYASIQRVRFDDDLPLSEQSIRRSCRQLYRSLYNQQLAQFRGPKPMESPRTFVSPPNGNPFCYPAPSPYVPEPSHPFFPTVDAYAVPANAQVPDPYWSLQPGNSGSLKRGRKYSSDLSLTGGIKPNGDHGPFPPNGTSNGERSLFLRQMILPNGDSDLQGKNHTTSTENLVVPKISVKRRSSVCSSYTDITCRQAVVTPTKEYCSRKDRMRRRSASSVSLHAFSLGRDGNLWVPELRKRYGLPPEPSPPWHLENGRADIWADRQCNFCSRNELHPVTTIMSKPPDANDYFNKDPHSQQLIPSTPRMLGRREMKALANGGHDFYPHPMRHSQRDFLTNGHQGPYPLTEKHKDLDTRSCYDAREMRPNYEGASQPDLPRTRPSSSIGLTKDSNGLPPPGRPEDFKVLEQQRENENKASTETNGDSKTQTSSTEITNEGSGSSSCSSLPDDFMSSQTTTGRSVTLSPFSSSGGTLSSGDFLGSQRKIVYKSDSAIHVSSRVVRKKSFLQKICEAARCMKQSLRRALSQENLKQPTDLVDMPQRAQVERNNSLRDSLFAQETNTSGSEHEAHVTGQLIQVHQDGSLLVELTKSTNQKTYGLYLAKGRVRNHQGVFVCRMANSKIRADLAGLLELGDEILQVNGMMANPEDIGRINKLLSACSTVLLTVMPYSYRNSLVYY